MRTINFDNKKIKPSKIVCIGRNYVEHIKELNNEMPTSMVIFMKPNSSISEELNSNEKDTIHYESEISFFIKDKNIYGVGFGLDLTKRDIQSRLKEKGLPWERAKSFDGSAVFSNFVKFDGNLDFLSLKLFINDTLVQDGGVNLMINKPKDMIKEIQSFSSFIDGDIVMSGTPKGVGVIKKGDMFFGQIFYNDKLLVQKQWLVE